MRTERRQPGRAILVAMCVAFGVGVVGWVWDAQEHAGNVHLGLGTAPAHLMMSLASLAAVGALAVVLARRSSRLAAYGLLAAGLALSFVYPLAGMVTLLALAVWAAWQSWSGEQRWYWLAAASVAMAVVLAGGLVDWFWHQAHPGVVETNMLELPGHAIQLGGLLAGLVSAGVALATTGRGVTERASAEGTGRSMAAAAPQMSTGGR